VRAVVGATEKRRYSPLHEVPHLFLEFARLAEQKDQLGALNAWIAKYGLLGLHRRGSRNRDLEASESSPDFRHNLGPLPDELEEYSDLGGTGETVALVKREMYLANTALLYWEALLSGEDDQLEKVIYGNERSREQTEPQQRKRRSESNQISATYVGSSLDAAVFVMHRVEEILEAFTYPCIAVAPIQFGQGGIIRPGTLARSWRPRNLLGAMYLQFYWLITSESDLSRCRYCGRIISYAPPVVESKARKPRKDKEFCDSRCRQNYHYHNRIKPERISEQR
jgi:hypothetical protein